MDAPSSSPASTSPIDAASPPPGEGCPTPLAWAEVVAAFESEGHLEEVPFAAGTISARRLGTGRPIYFLNGASGDSRLFALTAWLLREEFECIVVEYPRFTDSIPPRDYLPRTVDGLEALRTRLGHSSAAVYGAMFGGLVAAEWLKATPAPALTCGILQTPTIATPWTWLERLLLGTGRRLPGRVTSLPGWKPLQERNHRDWFPPFDPTRWDFLLGNLSETPIRDLAIRMRSTGAAIDADLSKIRQPVLLIRTEGEGRGHTQHAEELQARLPNARTEWMHTAGHLPFLTHPHRLVKLIRGFLADVPSRP